MAYQDLDIVYSEDRTLISSNTLVLQIAKIPTLKI